MQYTQAHAVQVSNLILLQHTHHYAGPLVPLANSDCAQTHNVQLDVLLYTYYANSKSGDITAAIKHLLCTISRDLKVGIQVSTMVKFL